MTGAMVYLTFLDPGGNLVFSGVDDDNPLGLLSMNEPARPKRRTFAEASAHSSGGLPTQIVSDMTEIRATVLLHGTSQADLEAKKARMRAVVEQFTYTAIQSINGVDTSWTCTAADISPYVDGLDVNDLEAFDAGYTLSIPCYLVGA